MLTLRNVTKSYRGFCWSKPDIAVSDISLSIRAGEICTLMGYNSAGKTTLVNLLSGLVSPNSGYCTIYGILMNNVNGRTQYFYKNSGY